MPSTVNVGFIVNKVRKNILDEDDVDYSDSEMVDLFNNTTKLIIKHDPAAYTIFSTELLVSGVEQSLPTNPRGLAIKDIDRNMGTDGSTDGDPVEETTLDAMNRTFPGWAQESQSTTTDNWMRVPDNPSKYLVSPPSNGTGYLRLLIVAIPTEAVYDDADNWESDVIPLDDKYIDSYITGMQYLAYNEDTDEPGSEKKSQLYLTRFKDSISAINPNLR